MPEPIVFISHFKVKQGKLDGFKQYFREGASVLEAEKPRTVAFLAYLNEKGTEATIVHVFPDAESMDLHVQGADERSAGAYEFMEPAGFDIYGTPSDHVLGMMREASLALQPQHLGGFLRLTPD